MGGGKPPSQTTTRTEAILPPYLQAAQQNIFNQAGQLYSRGAQPAYPGQLSASLTGSPYYQQYLNQVRGGAENWLLPLLESGNRLLDPARQGPGSAWYQTPLAGMQALAQSADILNNPALQRAVQGAIGQANRQFTEGVLPELRSSAAGSGAFGHTRLPILESQLAERAYRTAGDISAGMYSQAYESGQDRLVNAAQLAMQGYLGQLGAAQAAAQTMPGLGQLAMLPAEYYRQLAGDWQAAQQIGIDEARYRYEYPQAAPWDLLSRYSGIVSGQSVPTGTAATGPGQNIYGKSPLAGAIGGGMGGLGTYAGLVTALPALASNPLGWGLAGLGALGGLFGS
ncbi:MAG: hypothetical protein ACRD5H_00565 [Nitrososphaerales archaeon]